MQGVGRRGAFPNLSTTDLRSGAARGSFTQDVEMLFVRRVLGAWR